MDDKEKAEIVRLRDEGLTFKEIAKKLGRSAHGISVAYKRETEAKSKTKHVRGKKHQSIEIPLNTKPKSVAIIIVEPSQVKEVMESLWR
jgi:IS30 family transposase